MQQIYPMAGLNLSSHQSTMEPKQKELQNI